MRWRLAPILAALGVLLAQLVGSVSCPDTPTSCSTGATLLAARGDSATSSCCGDEAFIEPSDPACGADDAAACCCTPDAIQGDAIQGDAIQGDKAQGSCADTPLANCRRCGCDVRRAPPTPAPDRPSRTVEFKPSPAILNWIPTRPAASPLSFRAAHAGAKVILDRGRHRALLSVWVI